MCGQDVTEFLIAEESHTARMETVKRAYITPLISSSSVAPILTDPQITTVFRNWKQLVRVTARARGCGRAGKG